MAHAVDVVVDAHRGSSGAEAYQSIDRTRWHGTAWWWDESIYDDDRWVTTRPKNSEQGWCDTGFSVVGFVRFRAE